MAHQRVELITLGVSDLARSRRFYVDGLGWEPALDLDEVVFIQVGHGLLLGLFSASGLADDSGATVAADGHPPFSLARTFDSEDEVDDAVAEARSAGAAVTKEPQRAFWGGYHAYFADPDGFLWEMAHNPGLTVDDDGTVEIEPVD